MPLLIRQPDSRLERIADVPLSAGVGRLLRWDATGWRQAAENGSIVIPVVVDEPGDVAGEHVVLELGAAGRLGWALTFETDGHSSWRFAVRDLNHATLLESPNIGFNPRGLVCAIAIACRRLTETPGAAVWTLSLRVPGMTSTSCDERTIATELFAAAPDAVSLGHHRLPISSLNANMRGLCLIWAFRAGEMEHRLIADGRPRGTFESLDVGELVLPRGSPIDLCGPASSLPDALTLAVNHSCSGRLWNGYADCRPGSLSPTCAVHDRFASILPAYWNRGGGGVFTGQPLHVDPYAHARLASLPGPVNTSVMEGITTPFTAEGPVGRVGPLLARLVATAEGRTQSGQLRLLFAGNSRAVTGGGPAEVRLEDGTPTGRRLMSTYPEAGLSSIGALWRGALVGMVNLPIPTGLQNASPSQPEGSTDEPEPLYGPDCEAERPRCRRLSTNAIVPVSVATSRLLDGSYSRTWMGSRQATPLTGEAAHHQGNAAPRAVNLGYDYRMLVRPEVACPVTEELEVGFYVLRNPRASTFVFGKQSAASQAGDPREPLPQTLVPSDLDSDNVVSERLLAFADPLMSGDTSVMVEGLVVINNRSGAMTPGHLGQWLEITSSIGERRDVVCISAIDNSDPAECRVSYQGKVRNPPLVNFDRIHWMRTPVPRYRVIRVRFRPGEADGWRGLSVGVPSWATGNGVILLGAHFRNPSRPGLIAGQVARSGAGFRYQDSRLFTAVTPSLGTSPFDEMAALLAPDVMAFCTADQGELLGVPDAARSACRQYVRRWLASRPGLEAVLYSSGPEFVDESNFNYREDAKASMHVAYRQVAGDLGLPHASLFYDRSAGTGCMNSHLTGENTESRTHPSTASDIRRLFSQLRTLINRECPADFNRDGGVDGADIESFLTAWEAADSSADVTQDGGVDGADLEEFFRRWQDGGC